jgi:hypothetical protein
MMMGRSLDQQVRELIMIGWLVGWDEWLTGWSVGRLMNTTNTTI